MHNIDHKRKSGYIEVVCGPMFCGKTKELLRRLDLAQRAKQNTILFKPKTDTRYSVGEVVTHNDDRADSIVIEDADELLTKIEESERLIQKLFRTRESVRELFRSGEFDGLLKNENELSERFFGPMAIPGLHVVDPALANQSDQDESLIGKDIKEGKVRVVGIDEGQFIQGRFAEVCGELRDRGMRVIVAGLDMDFRRMPFEAKPTRNIGSLLAKADDVMKLKAVCHKCGGNASFSQRTTQSKEVVQLGGEKDYVAVCQSCYADPEEGQK